MERVKLECDLRLGTFSVEGPEESVYRVIERLDILFQKFWSAPPSEGSASVGSEEPSKPATDAAFAESAPKSEQLEIKPQGRAKRAASGKPKNYKHTDLPLNESQRDDLRKFYAEKSPKGQNNTVAALTVKAKQILSKDRFDIHDVFTLIRIAGAPVPKDMGAVFNNMRKASLGLRSGGDFVVNYLTEDHVNKSLSASKGGE